MCRLATPVSSQLPAGVPPGFEHLPGGALGRVKDHVPWAKRRSTLCQCPPSCVSCLWRYGSRTPASCASSRDVIVNGRGRRLHSILRTSNQVFSAQAIRLYIC
ncbi:hypothetical protein HPB52_016793 [Rhipicephalus sanguineus]|uniref:Uncharacterized protein n=1 Tax=Rhipicephalus sanguineus TaxID=34632 RepID=A0A9D4SQN4_RHISA|nr:hypothetical protein HPB52_016793 [Rhipicephalus sanguineus]